MQPRLLTPSKITAWLDCAHFLTLQHEVEAGLRTQPHSAFGDMAAMLFDKGIRHELDCLAYYEREGRTVFRVPERNAAAHESFEAWVARIGNPMADGHDVIYQMPFIHHGVRGIADFLVRADFRVGDPFRVGVPGEAVAYEPLDAKLARTAAKPGHVLQLCFYADAIAALTGRAPEHLHIWLGSGDIETIRVREVDAYWRRLTTQLDVAMGGTAPANTTPVRCKHCEFCAFSQTCEAQWRAEHALHYVAGLRTSDHEPLAAAGITNMIHLAECASEVETQIDPARFERLVRQASLQQRDVADVPPPFEHLQPSLDLSRADGFAAMPAPDDGDVFLDYEGHPFWSAKEELFFLFGLIICDGGGAWQYEARWAHTKADEGRQAGALIDWFERRRDQYPNMHVYHYNHTERSSLVRLAEEHTVGAEALQGLIDTGLFVDLYPVVTQALIVGIESYGLKHVERLAGFQRRGGIDKGAGAVVEYERFMADRLDERLSAIARYNDDDVRATLALRDWLVEQRPTGTPWRAAVITPPEASRPDIDDAATRLLERFPDTTSPEHLLGQVLGYWRREWKAVAGNLLAKAGMDPADQLADPTVIAGLEYVGQLERLGAKGRPITPSIELHFPPQPLSPKLHPRDGRRPGTVYSGPDGMMGFATVDAIDEAAGRLELVWSTKSHDLGIIPAAVVLNDHVSARPKPDALLAIANRVLDPAAHGSPSPVAMALLRRDEPRFTQGNGPVGGVFTDDVEQLRHLGLHLDGSYLPIQGPPGTGKTYTGARMVLELVLHDKRVGITAMSHQAIDNFMAGVVEAFEEAGELHRLQAIRRVPRAQPGGGAITYTIDNKQCAKADFNVVAGTTWLFAGKELQANPVDVLLIDEAGQLCLADALAASTSAHNLVLLGDPLQLPQVAQAAHPGRSGDSVLEHVLGDERTIAAHRGAFLSTTRRMHPDVSTFISEQIYEGRLRTHSSCAMQNTTMGTGLRWLQASHTGCSTESVEESSMVVRAIEGIIGKQFIDAAGKPHDITPADVMVVAPYNDQVNRLRADLDDNPITRGVEVGTVDKFQGREAPVVFFTMTASTAADIPRGADFLFSKNRLNVAISRARAIAYLVCTDELLNSRASDVESMKLIATLCAFVEQCQP